jgi:hypothetical protein
MKWLTPETLMHVIIIAALVLTFYHMLKPAKFRKVKQPVEADIACANDYQAVMQRLDLCINIEMCAKVDGEIEIFYDTYYDSAEKDLVDNYYVDLITRLTDIKINLRYKATEQR